MEIREYMGSNGEPINKQRVLDLLGVNTEVIEPLCQRIIEKMDFKALESITREVLRKTNLYEQEKELFETLVVQAVAELNEGLASHPDVGGGYSPLSHEIQILGNAATQDSIVGHIDLDIILKYYMCHEIAHMISRYVLKGFPTGDSASHISIEQHHGYSREKLKVRDLESETSLEESDFELFEEGITEQLGIEILLKYIKAEKEFRPENLREVQKLLKTARSNEDTYFLSRQLLGKLIMRLSSVSGFSEEDVWHAILRDKLEATGFDDPELKQLIGEAVSKDFLDKLAKAKSAHDLKNLMESIDKSGLPLTLKDRMKNRIRSWVKK